jgi:hypothetical protein
MGTALVVENGFCRTVKEIGLMQDRVKERIITGMLSCEICRGALAFSMEQPLRCPGLSYDKEGRAITPDGSFWDDIVKEHELKCKKERDDYNEKNKEHLATHLKEIKEKALHDSDNV